MSGFLGGLKQKRASTDPKSVDPRLRGRTYAIPFDAAWQAAVELCEGGIHGWSTVRKDDQAGVVIALVQPGPFSKHVDIRVVIALDENAQTRVDLTAISRTERGDFGRSTRLIDRFLVKLDEQLRAGPDTILDPARLDAFLSDFRVTAGVESEESAVPPESNEGPGPR